VPKVVDHGQRRDEMAAALWRIAAYEGLEAVSLNRVADEAGVSKGRVQHYFGSRDALLDHTAGLLTDRVTARLRAALAAAPDAAGFVRAALLEVMPLTEDSIVDTRVGIAFLIRALGDDAMRARYSGRNEEFLDLLTEYLTRARDDDTLVVDRDPRDVAVELFALVNGLKEPLLLGDLTPDGATAIVDDALGRLAP
jgi:AcrR family transcriptional regulator